jgi:hypothetical protein
MLKPPMPNVAGMTDTLEFVKNLWGSMNIPGVTVPGMSGSTLSTDELDKKIADLRAVESWLNLNIGMLRGTIQALEVQRGTIATLKSMGESMAQAMGGAGNGDAAMAPFAQFFGQAAQAAAPASAPPQKQEQQAPQQQPQQEAESGSAAPSAAMPAAVAWWNLLQEQFRQAVASAMPADGAAAKEGKATKEGGSPLDVSGGAPVSGKGNGGGGGGADAAPNGNPAPGRGTRSARSKADKA